MSMKLEINPIACTGHGLCADLLPELVEMDEWGYPIIGDRCRTTWPCTPGALSTPVRPSRSG